MTKRKTPVVKPAPAPRCLGVKVVRQEGEAAATIEIDHGDRELLAQAFGTSSVDLGIWSMVSLLGVMQDGNGVPEQAARASIALVEGIAPTNEVEGVLAVQIASAHALSLRMMHHAVCAQTMPARDSFINAATKLSRTLATQIEALSRLRRGGAQNVRVEHVHVHQGGQAIVGAITGGGGGRPGIGAQCDGREVYNAEVRGANALGDALPVASRSR